MSDRMVVRPSSRSSRPTRGAKCFDAFARACDNGDNLRSKLSISPVEWGRRVCGRSANPRRRGRSSGWTIATACPPKRGGRDVLVRWKARPQTGLHLEERRRGDPLRLRGAGVHRHGRAWRLEIRLLRELVGAVTRSTGSERLLKALVPSNCCVCSPASNRHPAGSGHSPERIG